MKRRFRFIPYIAGTIVILLSIGGAAIASPTVQAPEIDGGLVASGLGLLTAGILIVRSRRRRL